MDCFDEPYADPSTVPSYVISKQMSDNYKAVYLEIAEMNF